MLSLPYTYCMFSRAPIGLCPYVMIPRVELGLKKVRDQKFAILLASQRKMVKIKHSERCLIL